MKIQINHDGMEKYFHWIPKQRGDYEFHQTAVRGLIRLPAIPIYEWGVHMQIIHNTKGPKFHTFIELN